MDITSKEAAFMTKLLDAWDKDTERRLDSMSEWYDARVRGKLPTRVVSWTIKEKGNLLV